MPTDAALAAEIAREAGIALLDLRARFGPIEDEVRRRELMDAGDRLAQQILSDRLTAQRPEDSVLSEEAADSDARLAAERVWIIDPLDGTDEYGQGRTDFAVHVALWQRSAGPSGALTDAVVDVPALGELWRTDQPRPAGRAAAEPRAADRGLPVPTSRRPEPPARGRLGRPGRLGDHVPRASRRPTWARWGPSSVRYGRTGRGLPAPRWPQRVGPRRAARLRAGRGPGRPGPRTAVQPDAAHGRPGPDLPPRPGRGADRQLALIRPGPPRPTPQTLHQGSALLTGR